MKQFFTKNYWMIIALTCQIISSCSSLSDSERADDAIKEGWDLFAVGKYTESLSKFSEAISYDRDEQGGYHGKAWNYLLLNRPINAIDYFSQAIAKGNQSLDPLAGLAAAFLASENFEEAIVNAENVLSNDGNYFFTREPRINSQDLRLILAMAYFHEGRLNDAQLQVDFLAPSNGLNPEDSSTWIVNEETYSSYTSALMALIDRLDGMYGM